MSHPYPLCSISFFLQKPLIDSSLEFKSSKFSYFCVQVHPTIIFVIFRRLSGILILSLLTSLLLVRLSFRTNVSFLSGGFTASSLLACSFSTSLPGGNLFFFFLLGTHIFLQFQDTLITLCLNTAAFLPLSFFLYLHSGVSFFKKQILLTYLL